MQQLKATIETDIFVIEVRANIEGEEVEVTEVLFGDDPLNENQVKYFVKTYGELDLYSEILDQHRQEKEALEADMAGEKWEINQAFERR